MQTPLNESLPVKGILTPAFIGIAQICRSTGVTLRGSNSVMERTMMKMMMTIALLLMLCSVSVNCQQFTPGTRLNHLALDSNSKKVYVGAVNRVFRLNLTLVQEQEVDTSIQGEGDNWNKVLVIDPTDGRLVTCGSLQDGHCQTRELDDISSSVEYDSSTAVPVAADNPEDSTIAFVGPGPSGSPVLYVAATAVEGGNLRLKVPAISSRKLGQHAFAYASYDATSIVPVGTFLRLNATLEPWEDRNKIQYKAGFLIGGFSYFLAQQPTNFSKTQLPGTTLTSKIIQICHQDTVYSSYVEMPIFCQQNGDTFDLVKVAKTISPASTLNNGNTVIVGIFSSASEPNKNAVCVYRIEDIREKFTNNIKACYNGNGQLAAQFKTGSCSADIDSIDESFCGEPNSGKYPLDGSLGMMQEASHVFEDTDITAIALDKAGDNTVLFLGTQDGHVKKMILARDGGDDMSEFEDTSIHDGHAVQDIVMVPGEDYFLVMTGTKLEKIKKAECGGKDCSNCSERRNPYCGWCSLQDKCSRRSECDNYAKDDHFITFDEDICFELKDNTDRASVYQEQQIYFEISRLPPVTDENKYKCLFDGEEVDGTVSKSSGKLRCKSPPKEKLPEIPDSTDHTKVSLEVKSTETQMVFLETEVTFYDCETHEWCNQCTQSEWECGWCIYDNKCVDDKTDCAESTKVGDKQPADCPRLDTPVIGEEILIPAGHRTAVTFPGHNLPDLLQKYGRYECIFEGLSSTGEEVTISATKSGQDVICDEYEYWYEEATKNQSVTVRIQWNEVFNIQQKAIQVEVYKCQVLGPDCSSCLSLSLAGRDTQKYQCRWCSTDQCTYKDSCTKGTEDSCPKPIITMVEPLSAPIDGGTFITISGQNLGTQFNDIVNVTVSDQPCDPVREKYQVSTQIVCLSGVSASPTTGPVVVTVEGQPPETFSDNFRYRDPELRTVTPLRGIESGQTKVTITGQSLKTGASQQVKLGECSCQINSLNNSWVSCTTTRCSPGLKDVSMIFDSVERKFDQPFRYSPDPTVTTIFPLASFVSGGRTLTVTGTDLDSVQKPRMLLSNLDVSRVRRAAAQQANEHSAECASTSETTMVCESPRIAGDHTNASGDTYNISFDMDGTMVHPPTNFLQLQYVENPTIKRLNETSDIREYRKGTLEIIGNGFNLASRKDEITVTIGGEKCPVIDVTLTYIFCTPPEQQPAADDGKSLPDVKVKIGNFEKTIGKLKYIIIEDKPESKEWIIGVAVGGGFLITIIIIILIIYKRKSTEAERQYKKMQIQLDTLESNVRNECKQAFAELQTEVTDFTSDITVIGIPFWDYRSYTFKVLFPSHNDHPVLHNSSDYYTTKYGSYDQGLHQFNQLLNSKQFLLLFIRTLEQQKNFSIRDRAVVASLLMIVLQDKMEYATEIMKALLNELIDKSVEKKHPKLMLRRTESVVEKLLTNWLSLSMYGYLKKHAGKSLFMLCRAIKHQTEKGPVDAINCEARYSLSEDRLLREKIQPTTLTIHLETDDGHEPTSCKVLDCDTITQAKEKALDAIYLNTPFSKRPSVYDVDLEWRSGRSGHLPLQDEDVTTENINGWKRCNTLLHYHVPDGATMALAPKKNKNDMIRQVHGMVELTTSLSGVTPIITVEEGTKVWHLAKHDDGTNPSREKKVISEIFLTRLLATKGTLQQFIDDLFLTILKVDSSLPPAVKYLFDFLDLAARRHNIVDPDVVHTWKSNSLPLRFWVNIIKNPEFVFDIHKSHIVDSCLSVIAQTFMDSCSTSEHRLGKDSPSNKLLFAKDIPKYRGWVSRYYKGVQQMTPVSDAEITQVMTELSMTNNVDFNIAVALKELYKYATQYNFELLETLDDDPSARKLHLANKFEQAVAVIEGKPLY